MLDTVKSGAASASLNAILSGFTQATRLLKLSTPLGADRLLAECARAEEGLSQGYTLRIAALSTDAAMSLRTLIGQPALLELLAAPGGGAARPFHGHITGVENAGANGGLARYNLTVEPWTAFMALGRDSRIFQNMQVFDILDAVFAAYQGQGKLAPAWRFDILERDLYPRRSLCTQYQESDLAFAERLMSEEGLFYYFEHSADAASPGLGCHTLVIADHNGSFKPNAQAHIHFTQPGAVMKEDGLDRWRTELRQLTNAVDISSWDYRSVGSRPVGAAGAGPAPAVVLLSRDAPGAYAYQTREQGQRIADRQLQAFEAGKEIHIGAGTVRTLAPGTTFALHGHARFDGAAGDDARSFLVVRALHLMHNNLSAELRAGAQQRLGQGALDAANGKDLAASLHAAGKHIAERPLYRNRVDAIRANVAYRSSGVDRRGVLLHPRPSVHGQQTAIVVGPPGATIHTDRDHRVKVQFHWQRGAQSHSRLDHPAPHKHTDAPGDDSAGTWVRVATPLAPVAGANWGGNALPRVGQEVLVDFLEGNIDRPVVIGALYNGRGQADAQHNEVARGAGAATGNAPAWFPGTAGAHAHPASLSGIKTQALAASQGGAGAYNQLVFDDSPGQPRVALQRHAGAHQGTAELNLGHLRHQSDNQRLQPVGFGAELKTEHSAAVRAGRGLLLTADARAGAGGSQLDSQEALAQVEQSLQLQTDMAETAQKHNARLDDDKQQAEPAAGKLPAIADMAHTAQVLGASGDGAAAGAPPSGGGKVTAYSEPHLQLSSPAGIVATTPANALLAAGGSSAIVAGQDINGAAQGGIFYAVRAGISLFTYGKAANADKPNQETGIKLHAATGKLSSQSQSGATTLTADKAVTVASVAAGVGIAAKTHLLMTAQGAYLRLEGGNIMLHGPGLMEFKASMKELTGPADGSAGLPALPKAKDIYNEAFVVKNEKTGEAMAHVPYTMETASGVTVQGVTDELGRTQRLFTQKAEQIKLFLTDAD